MLPTHPMSASVSRAGGAHGPQKPCASGLAEHQLSQCRAAALLCMVLTQLGLCIDLLKVAQIPPNKPCNGSSPGVASGLQ